MASNEPTELPACAVCLETPDVLKVLPVCKHVFCCGCLSAYLQKLDESAARIPCPTCVVESPLPETGIAGLENKDGDLNTRSVDHSAVAACCQVNEDQERCTDDMSEDTPCQGCQYKGEQATAIELCEECGNLYLCSNCASAHSKNKVTQNHVPIPLKFKKKDRARVGTCITHGLQLHCFCVTCSKQCCHLCILFDHGDHDAGTIGEIVLSLTKDVKDLKEGHVGYKKELKDFENELWLIKSSNLKRQEVLINEIEDHAKKCSETINEEKETLKERVQDVFKMTKGVSESLDKVPGLSERFRSSFEKADQLLSEAESHPLDLEELIVLKEEMIRSAKELDEIRQAQYWNSFDNLWRDPVVFVPSEGTILGDVSKQNRDVNNCQLILEKIMEVDTDFDRSFIPCVANLGNGLYAVAHPTIRDQFSRAIDVYRIPGKLIQTITDHVPPLYDMAATPDGKLAILADGSAEGTSTVRLFDPVTGYIKSTGDLPIRSPLSFDINPRRQYVILSYARKKKVVNIVNEDGVVELTRVIDKYTCGTPNDRITCSARNIFILTWSSIQAFQLKGNQLVEVKTTSTEGPDPKAISSNYFDDLYTLHGSYASRYFYLGRYQLDCEELKHQDSKQVGYSVPSGECRISVRDGYIVSSWDYTIRVFKE